MSDDNTNATIEQSTTEQPVIEQPAVIEQPVADSSATEGGETTTDATSTENEPPKADESAVVAEPEQEPTPFEPYTFDADSFKIPDGASFEVEKAGEFVNTINGIAERHGLTKDQAADIGQEMIDLHWAQLQRALTDIAPTFEAKIESAKADALAQAEKAIADQSQEWKQTLVDDKEYGGKNQDATVNAAVGFMGKFTTNTERDSFVADLKKTGMINHPTLIKLMARAGNALLSENSQGPVPGATRAPQGTHLDRMYGNG